MDYTEKLKDPKWQKKRLEIFERDEWKCRFCAADDQTLHVHHLSYGKDPWDVPDDHLLTLCEGCHEFEHQNRSNAEEKLLSVLKLKGISYRALINLASGIHFMEPWHAEEVMFSVIEWVLQDKEKMMAITDQYFKYLHEKRQHLLEEEPF